MDIQDTPAEMPDDLFERAVLLFQKLASVIEGEDELVGFSALSMLLAKVIGTKFGEGAAQAFTNTMRATLEPFAKGGDTGAKRFMNLMIENGYDPPADIRSDEEKAVDADPLAVILRLLKEGKLTPEQEADVHAWAKKMTKHFPRSKKAKAGE